MDSANQSANASAVTVTFANAVLVKGVGVGHYRIADALRKQGLVIDDGFQTNDMPIVALLVPEGVSPTDAVAALEEVRAQLIESGEIVIPTTA